MPTTTFYVGGSGSYGRTRRAPGAAENLATIASGVGTAAESGSGNFMAYLSASYGASDTYNGLMRGEVSFDTSSIGSDVVSSVTLDTNITSVYNGFSIGSPVLDITGISPADPTSVAAADYQTVAGTILGSTPASSGAVNISLDPACVNTGGYTSLAARVHPEVSGSLGGVWAVGEALIVYLADSPSLTVTYAAPASGGLMLGCSI